MPPRSKTTKEHGTQQSEAFDERDANRSPHGSVGPVNQKRKPSGTGEVLGDALKKKLRIHDSPHEPPSNLPKLDVFVFGEGSGGELGLGSKVMKGRQGPIGVFRPILNDLLSDVRGNIVQLSCGGMHAIALTADNEVLTWGVNDHGALGRPTQVEEDDDDMMNPAESTPSPVTFPEDLEWAQVVAGDNASFALSTGGRVYGWGTFRDTNGVMGFNVPKDTQNVPMPVTGLRDITKLAAGTNHVLALDKNSKVFAWGCGEQSQLGRKIRITRGRLGSSLKPEGIGPLPVRGAKAVNLACGHYHSLVVDDQGRLYSWGLNNYGELGVPEGAGEDNAALLKPRLIESLLGYKIKDVAGGQHHSLACTDDGKLFTWGRVDGYQTGHGPEVFNVDNTIYDGSLNPRILHRPTIVPGIPPIESVGCAADHSFAVTRDGRVYSWGFSDSGRTGHGTEDDIVRPTLVNSRSIRDRKISRADGGGSYSILTSVKGG